MMRFQIYSTSLTKGSRLSQ
ncbi:hypothetical protein Goarm_002421 [Gossypium armourianum]|uniref:Uncharacterized protein n=1 Tax=Gossypium armourianum TaxID=34283 RepID=A0A7J9K831_9ROSI|nr:hypothetical protein [Gossypium armourianum]